MDVAFGDKHNCLISLLMNIILVSELRPRKQAQETQLNELTADVFENSDSLEGNVN